MILMNLDYKLTKVQEFKKRGPIGGTTKSW